MLHEKLICSINHGVVPGRKDSFQQYIGKFQKNIARGSIGRMYSETGRVAETRALRAAGVGLSLDPDGRKR